MKRLNHHIRSFQQAWSNILAHPVEHVINIIVLALVISMCSIGISFNGSLDTWKQNNLVYPQLVVYMDSNATDAEINQVQQTLTKIGAPIVHDFKYVSKQQALDEMRSDPKMKEIASDVIDPQNNILPDVIIVNTGTFESADLTKLSMQVSQLPLVDNVQMDQNYAAKIGSLFGFAGKISVTVQILLILVLSLVIYNMIRLQMMLRSDEIQVSRLIGASDSFIMRPLIHYAVWQVTLAAIVASITLMILTSKLNDLFAHFSNLFGNGFILHLITAKQMFVMWIILTIFAIFTVFLAVRWVFSHTHTR